jgi:hypothetical protein
MNRKDFPGIIGCPPLHLSDLDEKVKILVNSVNNVPEISEWLGVESR